MTGDLRARYDEVSQRVSDAAGRGGGPPPLVVAVSKTFPADVILRAAEQGIVEIGESRAQELKEKYAVVGDRVRWHFIGHLQTNKVRHVVGVARLIHSVDRFGLAEAISRRAAGLEIVQPVLIEVNIARDPKRHGVDPARAIRLATEVAALERIEVAGLMGMAPYLEDPAAARPYFAELRSLSEVLMQELPQAAEISMGMSRDYEVAAEEGATIVRVGEAIFGPRHR